MSFVLFVLGLATAVACLPIFIAGRQIARWEGMLFLLYYVAHVVFLILGPPIVRRWRASRT